MQSLSYTCTVEKESGRRNDFVKKNHVLSYSLYFEIVLLKKTFKVLSLSVTNTIIRNRKSKLAYIWNTD
jgi:hypothetical protein